MPVEPLALALGEERVVGSDPIISFNSVRYSTPPGYSGARVWCRVVGGELSITARTSSGDLSENWRHQLSTPGVPQIIDAHYPDHPDGRSVPAPPATTLGGRDRVRGHRPGSWTLAQGSRTRARTSGSRLGPPPRFPVDGTKPCRTHVTPVAWQSLAVERVNGRQLGTRTVHIATPTRSLSPCPREPFWRSSFRSWWCSPWPLWRSHS
ncbi:hypothetical protein [Streptomyces sp. NPDC058451]|uniref:Mu transposase domain-containing protein n=1 Tax=Streptomyces sp. NPDC058451 TaxID=3346506 RepID=UPI00365ECC17